VSGNSYAACFLVGSARSGTTWLSTALDAHSEVYCTEHRLFGRHFDVVHDGSGSAGRVRITLQSYCDSLATCCNLASLGEDAQHRIEYALARSLFDLAHQQTDARLIVDKITPYVGTATDVANGIASVFPGAGIIHLLRDPRDVVVSGVMHWLGRWKGEGPSAFQRQRDRWLLAGDNSSNPGRLFCDAEIEDWSRAWLEAREVVQRLPSDCRIHKVRYESLLNDRRTVLAQLFHWLGIDRTTEEVDRAAARSSFAAMSGGRAPGQSHPGAHVRKGVAGDWKVWLTRHDGELLWSRLGDAMIAESYASDDSWVGSLPETLGAIEQDLAATPV
jgi:hypothetical protein